MFRVIICFVLFLFSINMAAAQNTYECPKSIAAISGDPISQKGSKILTQVYSALGCSIEIVLLPGRRGISYFNHEKVDGELYRLNLIENVYSIKFVRSAYPLFEITNAIWVHPDLTDIKSENIGYVVGIAWHEEFMKNAPQEIPHMRVKFNSGEDMLNAYNNRKIGSFLSISQTVVYLSSQNRYLIAPNKFQNIESLPLFHYLQEKYAPFMKAFSSYLHEHQPFAKM